MKMRSRLSCRFCLTKMKREDGHWDHREHGVKHTTHQKPEISPCGPVSTNVTMPQPPDYDVVVQQFSVSRDIPPCSLL